MHDEEIQYFSILVREFKQINVGHKILNILR